MDFEKQWLTIIEGLKHNIGRSKSICLSYTDELKLTIECYNDIEDNDECIDLWFTFLSELFSLLNNIENENNFRMNQLKPILSTEIESVLKTMSGFISVKELFRNLIACSNARFKECKFLLAKMWSWYRNMNNVLVSGKRLLINHQVYFQKCYTKGRSFKISKCCVCNRVLTSRSGDEEKALLLKLIEKPQDDNWRVEVQCETCVSSQGSDKASSLIAVEKKENLSREMLLGKLNKINKEDFSFNMD